MVSALQSFGSSLINIAELKTVNGKISAQSHTLIMYILQLRLYSCFFFVLEGWYDSDACIINEGGCNVRAVWKSFQINCCRILQDRLCNTV